MLPQIFKKENNYDDLINKYASVNSIDPALLKAIISIESAFYEKSYRYEPHRNDASYGLTQLLYQTAKSLGYTGKPTDLYNPENSIKYGAKFLSYLNKQYSGNLGDIFASYNMGFPRPASQTTAIIIKLFGKPEPDWKYANQPYVDKGIAYYYYYKAKNSGNYALAEEIRQLIRKGDYKSVANLSKGSSLLKWLPLIITLVPFSLFFIFRKKKEN